MKIIAFDYGDSRTGAAICDKNEMLASPLTVISEKDFFVCAKKAAELVRSEEAGLIVVGYPKNMNNTIGERAEKCTKFAERLKKLTQIDTVMWDERCTTVSAVSILNETNVRGKKRRETVDAVAAVIILESYMAYRKNMAAI